MAALIAVGVLLCCSSSSVAYMFMKEDEPKSKSSEPTKKSKSSEPTKKSKSSEIASPSASPSASPPEQESSESEEFVVSDEAPVEEGTYIIDQRKWRRKCINDLKFCRGVTSWHKYKIESVGDNKYSILNTNTNKYCDSSLKCESDDTKDASRKFSFKAATGDYHSYHDGRKLDPDVKFYHMKGHTGWCVYGNPPFTCNTETPKERKEDVWGLRKK